LPWGWRFWAVRPSRCTEWPLQALAFPSPPSSALGCSLTQGQDPSQASRLYNAPHCPRHQHFNVFKLHSSSRHCPEPSQIINPAFLEYLGLSQSYHFLCCRKTSIESWQKVVMM
jgi:hypothetical protein